MDALEDQTIGELLTPEFLATLAEVGKRSGWDHDYQEVSSFIMGCFELVHQKVPNLEPYT